MTQQEIRDLFTVLMPLAFLASIVIGLLLSGGPFWPGVDDKDEGDSW